MVALIQGEPLPAGVADRVHFGAKLADPQRARELAKVIRNARYEEIDGEDHFLWVMPSWRDIGRTVVEFITGTSAQPATQRKFGTVVFTDIVDSTKQSAELGDAQWRAVLDGHDRLARS